MCSAYKALLALAFLGASAFGGETLRIAADPNNLPFSNDRLEGFENKIAALIAPELGMEIQYVWHAQRRGFFRESLKEGNCDLVMGVPAHFERALTTKPYYRSRYVFVSRADRGLALKTLDDPALRTLRIGVQLIGDDGMNTPPAHALTERGIVTNLVGFTLYGDYAEPNPPARIIDAVAKGQIDLAVVWGPLAGYFAKREPVKLEIVPTPNIEELPLSFAISVGVKKGNKELRDRVDEALAKKRAEIDAILREYGVPLDAGT
jgi:mxaJ protein